METLKVGALARRTGLSVRTLHHYDDIGLLPPKERTPAGHRLYGSNELVRLQRIQSLKSLGLALEEIRSCLDRRGFSLSRVVSLHLDALDADIERLRRLRAKLAWVREQAETEEGLTLDHLIDVVEATATLERHYTPDQLEQLARRREGLGDDRIDDVQRRWTSLIQRVQGARDRHAPVDDPEVRTLAAEWRSLTRDTREGFTGGDPGLAASLTSMWMEEPEAWTRFGMSSELVAFIQEAIHALDSRRSHTVQPGLP